MKRLRDGFGQYPSTLAELIQAMSECGCMFGKTYHRTNSPTITTEILSHKREKLGKVYISTYGKNRYHLSYSAEYLGAY